MKWEAKLDLLVTAANLLGYPQIPNFVIIAKLDSEILSPLVLLGALLDHHFVWGVLQLAPG